MKQPSEMTGPELNEAMAIEGMEWRKEKNLSCWMTCYGIYTGYHYNRILGGTYWNPTEDLNQVRGLEEKLLELEDWALGEYETALWLIIDDSEGRRKGEFSMLHASARQKCEALLMTFREVKNE